MATLPREVTKHGINSCRAAEPVRNIKYVHIKVCTKPVPITELIKDSDTL